MKLLCLVWVIIAACSPALAEPKDLPAATQVSVVVGPSAPQIERYAAEQLCGYLRALYGIQSEPVIALPDSADAYILVGTPATHPAARKLLDGTWPHVSDQGIVFKLAALNNKPALIVGGGSPAATLWAVSELAGRWGVRHLLHGDVLPQIPGPFRLPPRDLLLEPHLKVRQWRVMNAHACGPESWGMADYKPLLDQLAKLKFNRLLVYMWTWQPFLHVESGGIKRNSATLFFGYDFPITPDMPGRQLFGQATKFGNPDLPQSGSYQEQSAAGQKLIHSLLDYAHQRGMQCVINASPGEYMPEFGPLIKGSQKARQLGYLTMVPGSDTSMFDPALIELSSAIVRATVNTYPEADFLALGVQEHRQWVDQYKEAWKALDAKYGIEKILPLEEVLASTERRTGYPGGAKRAAQEAKGDIVTLRFYDHLFNDLKVLQGTRRPDMRLIYNCFAEELFPVLSRIVPKGSETMNFLDYTPSRIVRRRDVLNQMGGRALPSTLIYTLHDDNVGVLPQLATGSLHALTQELHRCGWAGFSTRYWLDGDHDPCVAYLSRAAWDEAATPAAVYRDQIATVCGAPCIPDMLTVFRELEAVTLILEEYGLQHGLSFPVPGMIMNQWKPTAMPPELVEVRQGYQRALEAARQALTLSGLTGRSYVQYWIGRLTFGIGYLDTIESVRLAAAAEKEGQAADAQQHADEALSKIRAALEAYASIAVDQSDRGAIATMAEFVYRPLKAKLDQLKTKAGK